MKVDVIRGEAKIGEVSATGEAGEKLATGNWLLAIVKGRAVLISVEDHLKVTGKTILRAMDTDPRYEEAPE